MARLPEPGGFEWVALFAADERLLRTLQARQGLHELAVQDAPHAHELPELERQSDSIFELRTAGPAGSRLLSGETQLFLGPGYLVSVRHRAPESHAPVPARLAAAPHLLAQGMGRVLHPILDFVVDHDAPVADHARRLAETIDALRETVVFACEAALLLGSRQHSDIQRHFAAWTAILAVPTAIAGIYGANFELVSETALAWG